ncbi:hypothetical protein T552_00920 [Pneumocystis carinii B80]|uniref:Elongator complex protein 1 n=1 Tax=Pneumocystis carinii (strain B80) TaxID=1408658 RepID=A0A0W4ZMX5_PNEC8|nr:hypothetical protein T552_00920 [Pneumocystis carinii B80]KTW29713.1 hypothetical protein T552_00920 [Pneumocystis carinii B80]
MRNLYLLKGEKTVLCNEKEEKRCINELSFNSSCYSSVIVCSLGEIDESILIGEMKNDLKVLTIVDKKTLWDLSSFLKLEIIDFQFLSEIQTSCIIMRNGDIVLIRNNASLEEEKAEIVGSVEGGIVAAKWAPDETILSICTGTSRFLLLSQSFETISEITLQESDINISNHVSIGWGKPETQFQGKKSKNISRDPTIPDKVDEGILSPLDDQITRISWRQDGAFVVLSKIESENKRINRVFSRNGTLDSVSQLVDYLESPLAWKPSGSVIASIQRKPKELDVIFFERNGLRHGEFSLLTSLLSDERIIDIQWNCDSTLLSILLSNKVQFWCMSNYYWHLKYEIKSNNNKNISIKWHPKVPLIFTLINDGNLILYNFSWVIISSPLSLPYDYGTIAVVDGNNLKLTPFKIANVPPPLSFKDIKLSGTPTSISISMDSNYILSLIDNKVEIIHWPLNTDLTSSPKLINKLDLTELLGDYYPRQILYLEDNIFTILLDTYNTSKILFFSYDLHKDFKLLNSITFESKIALTDAASDGKSVIAESIKGEVFNLFLKKDGEIDNILLFSLPLFCYCMKNIEYTKEKIVFFLSDTGKLFANDHLISNNCTSFICCKEYLIFTTTLHLVKFVKLTSKVEDFIIPSDEATNKNIRSIEKGAIIISVIPSITALIFQMPRGNIETIYPRALVLSSVYKLIELKKYDKAFSLCRTHRIDTNVLYDYNPSQFLDNIFLFITQLNSSEYLNLFLSTLKEEDLMKTLYNMESARDDTYNETKVLDTKSSKVNMICDCILKVLKTYSDDKYLESILTAHLSKIPVDYDSALKLIIDLKNIDLNNAKKGIKYICVLADVNKLYDHALGLYDLSLTLLVAQNSQKDPKEYLPFLEDLQKQSISRRCFNIDNYLERYEKALMHLIDIGDEVFDELCNYVVLHNLYKETLRKVQNNSSNYNKILELYALYLEKNNHFEDSAIAYEILNNYERSIIMYKNAGLWRKALTLAMKSKVSEDDLNKLAESLYFIMQDKRKFSDAADIQIYYLKNLKEGLRLLCKDYNYNKAYELAQYYNSNELIQEVIVPSLMDGFSELNELFSELSCQLKTQVERIRILKKKREQDPYAYFEANINDIPDDISLADTNTSVTASIFTRYTSYTTNTNSFYKKNQKNSRKEERRKVRKHKGSIWEEEYLLNSIIRLVDRLEDARNDSEKIIKGLLLERMNEKANILQKQMICLIEDVQESIKEIFAQNSEDLTENIQNNFKTIPVVRSVNELKILI